jgi:hypothetical protein
MQVPIQGNPTFTASRNFSLSFLFGTRLVYTSSISLLANPDLFLADASPVSLRALRIPGRNPSMNSTIRQPIQLRSCDLENGLELDIGTVFVALVGTLSDFWGFRCLGTFRASDFDMVKTAKRSAELVLHRWEARFHRVRSEGRNFKTCSSTFVPRYVVYSSVRLDLDKGYSKYIYQNRKGALARPEGFTPPLHPQIQPISAQNSRSSAPTGPS